MGGFLSDIRGKTITVDTALLNLSHSKLIQFYSSYRSICQGFTISIAEYTQIFGANQLSFSVWDTKYRGKIDAIEMFSGLIIFSKIKYQQKIKFLFEIFDFNEEGILNYQNIAFLIINVCNATYKVLSIAKNISQGMVESFLDEYFTKETQVQYPKLLRWTAKNQQALDFFREIGYQIESVMEQKRFDDYSYEQALKDRQKPKKIDPADKQLKMDQKFIAILDSLVDKKQDPLTENLNMQLHWIYGIDLCSQSIKFMKVQKQKADNERIIYSVGRIVIIYFPKLNLQRYYKGHSQSISVIEISKSKKLAASAERGQYPSIHIWDIEKRESLIKFKRLYKSSIRLMKFFKNDRYLATACESVKHETEETAIVILRLDTQQIILSTYLKLQITNIQLKEAQLDRQSQILLVSHTSICVLSQVSKAFKIQKVELLDEQQHQIELIKASLVHPKGWVITAHQNRKFMMWNQKNKGSLIQYMPLSSEEVIQLVLIGERILCILDQKDIQFVDIKIGQTYPFKSSRMAHLNESRLFNMRLQCMQLIEDCNLLVMSQFGDVIKITQIDSGCDVVFHKYHQIFKIQDVSNCFSWGANNIIFTTPRFLCLVDRFQKELRILARQQFSIEHASIDNDNLVVTNPHDGKFTYLRLVNLQNLNVREIVKIGSIIIDIKIVENYIIALSDTAVYVFHKTQDKYFERQPTIHKATITKLCSMALQADQHQLLILSQNKQIFRFPLNGNSPFELQKIEKIQQNPIYKQLTIQYPQQNHRYPLVIKGNQKLVAMGKRNGQLLFWESLNQATNHHSSMGLTYHSERISRLLLNNNSFFSVGSIDGMVAHLQHKPYLQAKQNDQFEIQGQIGEKNNLNQGDRVKSKQNDSKRSMIIKQLQGLTLREGQVEISGLLEPDNSDIRQIIHQILISKDKSFEKNLFQQFSKENKTCKASLQTAFIFGINTNKCNGGVYYIHSYPSESPLKKRINESYWENSRVQQGNKEQLQFAKNLLLPLDDDHTNCKKQILFSTDRYCIISNKGAAQNIYDFHRRKVSAIAVHPSKQIICSCEVSATFPKIHIWKHEQRATIKVLLSKHRSVISKAEFSRDGKWIVTLGGIEKAQSIQIFDWLNEQSLGFKCIQNALIKQILFNPYDKKELCVAGENIIQIYRIEEELVFIKQECIVLEQNFLAAVYTSNVYGSEVESDLITGSQEGDIGLYVCGSFLYSKKKAHQGGITCLRLAQLFKYKRVLLSGGKDGFVRLWDIKFNEISKKNIKQELYSLKNSTNLMPNCSIISLDVFHCQKKQGSEISLSTLLLIATSDGSILQATISNEFQGYKAVVISTAQTQNLKQKINFDISVALSAPSNQHTYRFVVCNNMLITYSNKISFLYFWNIHFHTREQILPLSSPPLFVSTLNAQPIILVGQQDQSTISVKMFRMQWAAGTYLRSVTQCGTIQVQKGNLFLKAAYASKNDNRLALIIKIQESDEVLLYEKQQSQDGNIHYTLRLKLDEKVPNFLNRVGWIQFSANEENIIIAWYESKNQTSTDFQTKYKCYSCNNGTNTSIGFFQFQRFDFSSKVKASYVPCFQLAGLSQKDYMLKDNLPITVMTEYEGCLFMGTINGQILIVESQAFAKRQAENKYYAKSYIITDSPITKLQIRENDLIVGSESGEGIFIVKIKTDQGLVAIEGFKDIFNENINGQQWQKKIKEVYQKRRKIESEDEYICKGLDVDLQLSAVIGRSAYFKRNNIFIDLKDNIISHSGCNILIMKKQEGQRLNQRTIKPDVSLGTTHPQISSICLGECKRFLLVGTSQQCAKIIAWDISTNTYLFDIKLNGFVEVNLIKICSSNRYCVTLVTTRFKIQYLLFIDVFARTVLAVHNFHRQSYINDICFGIDQEFKIVSCGVNYMAQWNYCNNILMENHYKLSSGQQSQEVKVEPIIFYSIIFIGQYAITSGSDGYLYVWKEQKLIKKQNAHPKQPILSLYTSINSKIFVSGANNGTVIIWHFSPNLIIQKVDEYNIYNGKQAKVPPKYHVQSICMTKQSLIVGNRAGQILHFPFPVSQQSEQKSAITNKSPQLILASFDHERIISCAFNASSRKLYIMTQAEEGGTGTFAVLDVGSLQRIKQQKVDLKSGLVRMIACKGSPKILVVLKNSILTFNYQAEIKDDKYNKFQRRKEFAKFDNILAAAVNHNQTFLAVLYAKADTKHPILQFYSLLSVSPEKQFYTEYKVQIPNHIQICQFDFCVDHDYVLLQSKQQEQVIIDLMNKKKVNSGTLQNPPQWNEDLKKTSPTIKEISNFYSQDNQLLKLAQIMNKSIIATDQMGSLRLFKYPIEPNKEQEYKVYIHHLNHIYICTLSHDSTTLATVSREDKAILLWQVVHSK